MSPLLQDKAASCSATWGGLSLSDLCVAGIKVVLLPLCSSAALLVLVSLFLPWIARAAELSIGRSLQIIRREGGLISI